MKKPTDAELRRQKPYTFWRVDKPIIIFTDYRDWGACPAIVQLLHSWDSTTEENWVSLSNFTASYVGTIHSRQIKEFSVTTTRYEYDVVTRVMTGNYIVRVLKHLGFRNILHRQGEVSSKNVCVITRNILEPLKPKTTPTLRYVGHILEIEK